MKCYYFFFYLLILLWGCQSKSNSEERLRKANLLLEEIVKDRHLEFYDLISYHNVKAGSRREPSLQLVDLLVREIEKNYDKAENLKQAFKKNKESVEKPMADPNNAQALIYLIEAQVLINSLDKLVSHIDSLNSIPGWGKMHSFFTSNSENMFYRNSDSYKRKTILETHFSDASRDEIILFLTQIQFKLLHIAKFVANGFISALDITPSIRFELKVIPYLIPKNNFVKAEEFYEADLLVGTSNYSSFPDIKRIKISMDSQELEGQYSYYLFNGIRYLDLGIHRWGANIQLARNGFPSEDTLVSIQKEILVLPESEEDAELRKFMKEKYKFKWSR